MLNMYIKARDPCPDGTGYKDADSTQNFSTLPENGDSLRVTDPGNTLRRKLHYSALEVESRWMNTVNRAKCDKDAVMMWRDLLNNVYNLMATYEFIL